MKRMVVPVVLCALLLCATGCSSILERSYSSVSVHQEQSVSDEDSSILRAETYADLVSCVQHFVTVAQTTGTVHVYKYTGDIAADLQTACNEVLTEDPMGAYALSGISFTYSRIVSYYECTFTFTYRRTLEDMTSIITANTKVSIREQLERAMEGFETTLTLRTTSYYASSSELYSMVQDAYYSSPGTALGYPDVTISIYPDSGDVRIVEIQFSYGQSQEILLQHAEEVAATAAVLAGQDTAADATVAWLLYSRLTDNTTYASAGSSSVYNALCLGRGNSEAMALSYQLLCNLAGISCQVVQGTLDGTPHCWNLITLGETSWMLDTTQSSGEDGFLHNDSYMLYAGYSWSREDYPACEGEEMLPEEELTDEELMEEEISEWEENDWEELPETEEDTPTEFAPEN